MKIWFDTEFIEDGRTIDLLSIGMVREDGAEYYAETMLASLVKEGSHEVDPWLQANVVPYLSEDPYGWTEKPIMAQQIIKFAGESPEFWAYYADYDWVALCQLFGRMIDLPKGWPMYCRDFKQEMDRYGYVKLEQNDELDGPEHHALSDAKWLKRNMLSATVPSVGHYCKCLGSYRFSCGGSTCHPTCKVCRP